MKRTDDQSLLVLPRREWIGSSVPAASSQRLGVGGPRAGWWESATGRQPPGRRQVVPAGEGEKKGTARTRRAWARGPLPVTARRRQRYVTGERVKGLSEGKSHPPTRRHRHLQTDTSATALWERPWVPREMIDGCIGWGVLVRGLTAP
jgi:hypothetical protein